MSIQRIEGSPVSQYLEAAESRIGADADTQIAAMMLEHARTNREDARVERNSQEAYLRMRENAQVAAMRQEADAIRDAGFAKGIGQCISGGTQMAGAAVLLADGGDTAKSIAEGLGGAGTTAGGIGTMVAAHHDYKAAKYRADQTSQGNRADEAKRRLDDLKEAHAESQELSRTAMNHLQQVMETNAQADQAAIFQRV